MSSFPCMHWCIVEKPLNGRVFSCMHQCIVEKPHSENTFPWQCFKIYSILLQGKSSVPWHPKPIRIQHFSVCVIT